MSQWRDDKYVWENLTQMRINLILIVLILLFTFVKLYYQKSWNFKWDIDLKKGSHFINIKKNALDLFRFF